MIYALLGLLKEWDLPGHNLLGYISFRAGISFALSSLLRSDTR